jgi:putative phage-type endonuclease
VYLDKIGERFTEENEAMYWGTTLEEIVAKEFVKRMSGEEGLKYCPVPGKWKASKVNAILQHDSEDWMLANLDRLLALPDGSKAILECKTASVYASKDWDEGSTPEGYWCQVQWYMGITDVHRCFVAVLIGGQRFEVREVLFDEAAFGVMVSKAREFMELVEARTPPALDGSDDGMILLQTLFSDPRPDVIQLPYMAAGLIDNYNQAKAEMSAAELKVEFNKQHLCNMLGDNAIEGQIEGWKVTWKPQDRATLDTKKIKADYPAIADAYTKVSTSRVFKLLSSN